MPVVRYITIALMPLSVIGVGLLNTHTDELLVVLPVVGLLAGLSGLIWPGQPWLWAGGIGGAVPLSQLVAMLFGWHVPYPNDVAAIETSCFALAPAFLTAYLGAGLRKLVESSARTTAA